MARKPVPQPVVFSGQRSCVILLVAVLILAGLAYEAIIPLRQTIAKRYLARGDRAFAALQFADAEVEYNRALRYDRNLTTASERKEAAQVVQYDPATVRAVITELGADQFVTKLDQATASFSDAPAAYVAGVGLYEQGEYALARYPLEQAVSLDPAYPDSWHYLYLTYSKLAEVHSDFRQQAAEAKAKRDELSARWLQSGD